MSIISPRSLAMACLIFMTAAAWAEGPLVVTVPEGWSVSYKDQTQFYVLRKLPEEGRGALLMFSGTLFANEQTEIPEFIKTVSDEFVKNAQGNPKLADMDPNYTVEKLQGQAFSGEAAVFKIGDVVQTSFMVSDGLGNWNGQFTGSTEDWQVAKGVLEGLKRSP